MALQYQYSVRDARAYPAVFRPFQARLPVLIRLRHILTEIKDGLRLPVPCQRQPRFLVPIQQELHHRRIAGAFPAAFFLRAVVQMAKFMDAHKIKGIAKPAARRVCAVVGIGERVPVVYHQPCRRRTSCIGIPVRLHCRHIDIRQKFADCP